MRGFVCDFASIDGHDRICSAGHFGGRPKGSDCVRCEHRLVDGQPVSLRVGNKVFYGSMDRAAAYLKAEAIHAIQGPAPEADAALRRAECLACEHRVEQLDGATDPDGVGFCTRCGCGGAPRAALGTKIGMAGASCPLGKWKPVQGTGATPAAIAEAMAGVMSTLAAKLLPKKPE
jgi:hypothetical protein